VFLHTSKRLLFTLLLIICFSWPFFSSPSVSYSTTEHCRSGFEIKIESKDAPFEYTTSESKVIRKICVKSGTKTFSSLRNINNGCYTFSGIGTKTGKVEKTGADSPTCQDISYAVFYTKRKCGGHCPQPSPSPVVSPEPSSKPSPEPSPTSSPEPSPSPTPLLSPIPSPAPSPEPSPTPTETPLLTPSPQASPVLTSTPTPTPSAVPSSSPTPIPTPTQASPEPSDDDNNDDRDNDDDDHDSTNDDDSSDNKSEEPTTSNDVAQAVIASTVLPQVLGASDTYNPLIEGLKLGFGEILGATTYPYTSNEVENISSEIGGEPKKSANNLTVTDYYLLSPRTNQFWSVYQGYRVGEDLAVGSQEISFLPGYNNRVIYGHNTKEVFGQVRGLPYGSKIMFGESGKFSAYQLIKSKAVGVLGRDLSSLSVADDELLLITCAGQSDELRLILTFKKL